MIGSSRRLKIKTAIVGLKNIQNAEQSGVFYIFFKNRPKKIAVFILAQNLLMHKITKQFTNNIKILRGVLFFRNKINNKLNWTFLSIYSLNFYSI